MLNVILLGPPGVGKGTQSSNIARHFELIHISTGELLREEMAQGTPLGLQIQQLMDSGQYVSDDIACGLVRREIDPTRGLVLDGFPRTIPQAETLDTMLTGLGRKLDRVIELRADHPTLIQRMMDRAKTSGRADDTPEIFGERLRTYDAKTAPLIKYYSDKGLLVSIDSLDKIPVVTQRIISVLE